MLNFKADYTDYIDELFDESRIATEHAYAPYSNVKVGCAVLCKNGNIYAGGNIENVAPECSISAERVALSKAIASGDSDFIAMALYSEDANPYPTGAGLQMIVEFNKKMPIFVVNDSGYREYRAQDLLYKSYGVFND